MCCSWCNVTIVLQLHKASKNRPACYVKANIYPVLTPQTDFQPPNPRAAFILCWRIWTNYLHMRLKEPHGKGAKKNILLTEHKHWPHQASRAAACSDALHMLTWHWQPFAESTTSPQWCSLSSDAACCSVCQLGGNVSASVFPQAPKW